MSSTTTIRHRDPTAGTAPARVQDQHNSSFAEEHALDAIAKEVRLRLARSSFGGHLLICSFSQG